MRRTAAGLSLIAVAALAACSTQAAPHPAPTVTRTAVRTVTRTVSRPVPGPTVTVTEQADNPAETACIQALYHNIQSWKASGIVPNRWWDARCMQWTP
jgi:hypothetical protein